MASSNYIREIQKFTSSQYWNSGVRITAGVLIPMVIIASEDLLSQGIPFLFGALFVSIADTPGPIHHRRNGMLAAIVINSLMALLTGLVKSNPYLLLTEIIVCSFILTFINSYGARAGSIGILGMVIMLINMSDHHANQSAFENALLVMSGGLWYMLFSLLLYRLQPYRFAEQALGEYLMRIAEYLRARAALYKPGANIDEAFKRVMTEHVAVVTMQNQVREVLFKTRQYVGDPSLKSRSMMMVFLECSEMFEETMHAYQDYRSLHEIWGESPVLSKIYRSVLQVVAEAEYFAMLIQSGDAPKSESSLLSKIALPFDEVEAMRNDTSSSAQIATIEGISRSLINIRHIAERLVNISRYARQQAISAESVQSDITMPKTKFDLTVIRENLTWRSNHFRFALRTTLAMLIAYGVSAMFALSHAYWVMLTVITILKPVYHFTRRRNYQRVLGTLIGVLLGAGVLFLTGSNTILFLLMVLCMLLAYSFLRINYLGFVIFLTIYIIITFHFLNPVEFRKLIGERLIDTLIGSGIAFLVGRFILPVWQKENIASLVMKMNQDNALYFRSTIDLLLNQGTQAEYQTSKNTAIVSLTNLSDTFQQMLSEPSQDETSSLVHQFVIASHTFTGRVSALTKANIEEVKSSIEALKKVVVDILGPPPNNEKNLDAKKVSGFTDVPSLSQMSLICSLAVELNSISIRIQRIMGNQAN
jgi:uncharacterized membrane protein YccC